MYAVRASFPLGEPAVTPALRAQYGGLPGGGAASRVKQAASCWEVG